MMWSLPRKRPTTVWNDSFQQETDFRMSEPSRNHRPGRSPQPRAAQPGRRMVQLLVAGTLWAAVILVLSTDSFSWSPPAFSSARSCASFVLPSRRSGSCSCTISSESRALRLVFCFLRAHLSRCRSVAPGLPRELRARRLVDRRLLGLGRISSRRCVLGGAQFFRLLITLRLTPSWR
jgi:hypothetical protein